VLRLALGGFSAAEIATRLAIAETTAQVYLKRLLQKTNSRNRAQMVATVLGSRMSHDTDVHDVIGAPPEPMENQSSKTMLAVWCPLKPRGPLKMYQLWPLENVPGIGSR
jgi:hypothetical protein